MERAESPHATLIFYIPNIHLLPYADFIPQAYLLHYADFIPQTYLLHYADFIFPTGLMHCIVCLRQRIKKAPNPHRYCVFDAFNLVARGRLEAKQSL